MNDTTMGFELSTIDLAWIDGSSYNPDDLCLHGHVKVRIGDSILDDGTGGPWCVSAGAYRFLQSLHDDHPSAMASSSLGFENHLMPCCGHFMYIDEPSDQLVIIECQNGIDWSCIHEGSDVRLGADGMHDVVLPLTQYAQVVFDFADAVSAFYQCCSPKRPQHDGVTDVAFTRFWADWQQLRDDPL